MKKIKPNKNQQSKTKHTNFPTSSNPQLQKPDPLSSNFDKWKQKEEEFHLDQAVLRSKIRIEQNREQPIDLLARVILIIQDKLPIPAEFREESYKKPYTILETLSLKQLEDLTKEIETFQSIEQGNKQFQNYWAAMSTLNQIQIQKLKKLSAKAIQEAELGLKLQNEEKLCNDEELEREAEEMIKGKSLQELKELEEEIELSLAQDKSFALDIQYWQNLIQKIKIFYARVQIEEVIDQFESSNQDLISKQIQIAEQKKIQKQKELLENQNKYQNPFTSLAINNTKSLKGKEEQKNEDQVDKGDSQQIIEEIQNQKKLRALEIEKELQELKEFYKEKAQEEHLKKQQNTVDRVKKTALNTMVRFDLEEQFTHEKSCMAVYEELKRRGVGPDEQEFTDVVSSNIQDEKYEGEDKYKPRKPKFFNTVQTGYEWNKYNQTHYDADNPPPKVVQGYKFNLFYPDLIDKTQPPQFYLEQTKSSDTLIVRFSAGPPYQDIAFKIVNREWEMSERHGFRCVFDRGVYYLHFSFKKHKYRR